MTGFDQLEHQLRQRVAERRRSRRRRLLPFLRMPQMRALRSSPLGAAVAVSALAGAAAAVVVATSATSQLSIAARAYEATGTSGKVVHYVEVASYAPPPGMGLRQVKRHAAVWVSGGRSRVIETVTLFFLSGRHTTVQHVSTTGGVSAPPAATPTGRPSPKAVAPVPAAAVPAAPCLTSGACAAGASAQISALRQLYLQGKLRDAGQTVQDGQRLDVLVSDEGPSMRVLVDPRDFLPVEILTRYRSAGSGTLVAKTMIEDYRQLPLTPSAASMLAPRCHVWQLSARLGSRTPVSGGFRRIVTLANSSSSTCTLYGYPGMLMLDAAGRPVPTHVHRGAFMKIPALAERSVALDPGGAASFAVGYLHGGFTSSPHGGFMRASCPAARMVEVTPPNAYRHLTIRWALHPFGGASGPRCGTVTVSPVYPGAGAPPRPEPPSPTPEPVAPAMRRCHTSQLTARLGRGGVAAGHEGQVLTFMNASGAACSLYGYPGMQMVGARGQRLPTHVHRGASYIVPSLPVRRVVLQPGWEASFQAGYEDATGFDGIACPAASAMLITPPNAYRPIRVRWAPQPYGGPHHDMHGCGEMTVSPVYEGPGTPPAGARQASAG